MIKLIRFINLTLGVINEKRSVGKIIIMALIILLATVALFVSVTFIFHRIKSSEEIGMLKEKGYYSIIQNESTRRGDDMSTQSSSRLSLFTAAQILVVC